MEISLLDDTDLSIFHSLYHGWWWLGDTKTQCKGINTTLFSILPRRIISKIRLKMPNHQKIFIKYAISFWIGNKKPCYRRMIVLNHYLTHLSIILMKKKMNCNLETSLNSPTDQVPDSVSIFCDVSSEQFNVVSKADIRKIISSSSTKSCALDPIPTWLL